MNDKIDKSLFHGVGVVDFFKKNLSENDIKSQKSLAELDKILDLNDDDRDYILNYIKEKTDSIGKFDSSIKPTKEQLDYLNSINAKITDRPFAKEMNKVRKIASKLNESSELSDAQDIIFKLSSFAFCHLIESKHDASQTIEITEDAVYYLNFIASLFPALEEDTTKIKESYLSLLYGHLINNYFSDEIDENFDVVSLIMDFNREDIDSLFGLDDRKFPNSYIDDLLSMLEAEQEMELNSGLTIDGEHKFFGDNPGDGQGFYLQFILMSNSGKFRDNYDDLYKKFMSFDISNMYLNKALSAQYDNKKSQGKMLMKHVDESKLFNGYLPVYRELEAAFAAQGRTKFKSKDLSSEIAKLLICDEENILPTLLVDLDAPLKSFCINYLEGDLLDGERFIANDIEFLLQFSPKTISGYLLKPTKFILKKDISELYKMSVYLLSLGLLDESRMIIVKLLEISKISKNLFNDDEFKILELQLILLELSLGYKK